MKEIALLQLNDTFSVIATQVCYFELKERVEKRLFRKPIKWYQVYIQCKNNQIMLKEYQSRLAALKEKLRMEQIVWDWTCGRVQFST